MPLWYYRTDTHANMIGSLFMVSDLLEGCYGAKITPDPDKFEIHMQDYAGDLAAAAKMYGQVCRYGLLLSRSGCGGGGEAGIFPDARGRFFQ